MTALNQPRYKHKNTIRKISLDYHFEKNPNKYWDIIFLSISHTPTGNPALNQTWFANLAKLLFSWFIWSVAKTLPGDQLRPVNSLFNRDMSFHGQDRIRIFIITNLRWRQRAFISSITEGGKMTPVKLCFRLLYTWHKQASYLSTLLHWGKLIIGQ